MRTDLQIVQQPAAPDFSAGKNTIRIDPDFGQPIVRLSDTTDYNGATIKTADAADTGLWNHDDSMFMAKATGGWPVLYQFNAATMQGKRVSFNFNANSYCFSKVNRAVLYALKGTVITRINFVLDATGNWNVGTTSTVCDFQKILPTGQTYSWSSVFLCSQDDTTFTVGFGTGVQNTAIYVASYQTGHAGQCYRLLNTQTGQITGQWGTTGQAILTSPALAFPFTLHEVWQTPNPQYVVITPAGGTTQIIWTLGTLSIYDPHDSGHQCYGNANLYNGGMGGGQVQEINYVTDAKRSVIPKALLPSGQIPAQSYTGDQHFAFGHLDPLDQSIIWVSSQSQVSPFTSCWMNEVRGVRVIDGVVFRACHTFNSGNHPEFDVAHAIAVPSQTGNFVAFSSDMMTSRGDVYVVKTSS